MAAVKELKLVLWNLSADDIPIGPGNIKALDFDYEALPGLFEQLGDQWKIVNHNVTVKPDGELLLSLFLERPIVAPRVNQIG